MRFKKEAFWDKRKLLEEYGKGTFKTIEEAEAAVKLKFKKIFGNNVEVYSPPHF